MIFGLIWIDCLTLIDDSDDDSDYLQEDDEMDPWSEDEEKVVVGLIPLKEKGEDFSDEDLDDSDDPDYSSKHLPRQEPPPHPLL